MAQDDKKSVCCSWYLRNHISYDCYLWYTMVKWWYFWVVFFFFIFSKFWLFGVLRGGGGWKGKKLSRIRKKAVLHAPYFRNHTSYIIIQNNISSSFFHFFKILIFWIVREVKMQKIPQNKKLCLSHLICQKSYIIWSSFVVHKCKIIISPGLFFAT